MTFKTTLDQRKLVKFDAALPDHLEEARHYFENGRWYHTCPFDLELGNLSVPHMIAVKLAMKHLGIADK